MNEMVLARAARRRARLPGQGRRRFLKSALGALIALPAGAAFAAPGVVPPPPAMAGAATGGLLARRVGAHFLVEGWVLTEADLRALGIAVPSPSGAEAARS